MRGYSLENEKATFFTGKALDYPGTIPYSDFTLIRIIAQYPVHVSTV